jgi:hypothetical protein
MMPIIVNPTPKEEEEEAILMPMDNPKHQEHVTTANKLAT